MFTCPKCQKEFASRFSLTRHLKNKKRACDAPKEKPYQCLKCLKEFTNLKNLEHHKENQVCQQQISICFTCGQIFPTMYELVQHDKQGHSGEGSL